jgi:hypothetical protein
VPAEMPFTIPDVAPIAATDAALLVQVPPLTVLLSVVVEPVQTEIDPGVEPADGVAVTVTVRVV